MSHFVAGRRAKYEIPRGASGKVRKDVLRETYA